MNFDYTEFDNYFLVLFEIDSIPFSAMVDKESKEIVDCSTLTNGTFDNRPYEKNTPLKQMNWLSVSYFAIEDSLKEYFK